MQKNCDNKNGYRTNKGKIDNYNFDKNNIKN